MEAFKSLTGVAAPLPMINVDTDMIIPKQFLKTIKREGLGEGLFYELKTNQDGSINPDFVLNKPAYKKSKILIAGANFGCGSSREHAPWALHDFGIRCVIAPSFGDIFYNNSFKNGFLPIVLMDFQVDHLFTEIAAHAGLKATIDLPAQTVTLPNQKPMNFDIEPFRKECLVNGWDEIGLTLRHKDEIKAYEEKRKRSEPWIFS